MTPYQAIDEADTADLSLEMMTKAYIAIATLYDLAMPGIYPEIHVLMKAYLVENFRVAEGRIGQGLISEAAFKAAVLKTRDILMSVERELTPARPNGATGGDMQRTCSG